MLHCSGVRTGVSAFSAQLDIRQTCRRRLALYSVRCRLACAVPPLCCIYLPHQLCASLTGLVFLGPRPGNRQAACAARRPVGSLLRGCLPRCLPVLLRHGQRRCAVAAMSATPAAVNAQQGSETIATAGAAPASRLPEPAVDDAPGRAAALSPAASPVDVSEAHTLHVAVSQKWHVRFRQGVPPTSSGRFAFWASYDCRKIRACLSCTMHEWKF